jgi:hypothetical protein
MFKVKFFDKNRKQYDSCEFNLVPGESLNGKLEEILYIMQELTPQHLLWKMDLACCGTCLFTYHGTETVMVSVNGFEISVRDC